MGGRDEMLLSCLLRGVGEEGLAWEDVEKRTKGEMHGRDVREGWRGNCSPAFWWGLKGEQLGWEEFCGRAK